MKTTIDIRGSVLVLCWLGLFCSMTGVAVWLLFTAFWGFLTFLILFSLCAVLCRLHRIGYAVEITDRECILRRGFFLHSIVKIPLRYITAATSFSTPLSRSLKVGVLALFSSGRLTVMIGLPLADIKEMRRLLTERQA